MAYEYKFDRESCWFKKVCTAYKSNTCEKFCVRYTEFDFLIYASRLPKKLQYPAKLTPEDKDLACFTMLDDLRSDILTFVEEGENLIIAGANTGNGKTTWAVKLLLRYFQEVWACNGFRPRGLFISTSSLFFAIKQSFSKENDVKEILDLIPKVDLIVWDDVAVKSLTAFEQDLLYDFINTRMNNGLSNIFTTNILPENLEVEIGKRIASRIMSGNQAFILGRDRRHG